MCLIFMCHTTRSSPTNEDEPSDGHVNHQKSRTFYRKSGDDVLVWHVSFASFITDAWWWTSNCRVSIRKSPTFYQKSPTFIQKSPCILSREACAWHVELSVCKIFRLKSPTFWQKSPTINQRPVPDMLNFLIATRGKRACICGSFGCWCCSMLQCVAVCCSVLQCEGSLKHACICRCFGSWCCSVLQCVAVCRLIETGLASVGLLTVRVAVCCSVLQCEGWLKRACICGSFGRWC